MFDLTWYDTLNLPPLTPPGWIFAPVWTILYISMLVSLIIYATKPSNINKEWGFTLFFIQIILNLCWTPAFFCMESPALGLAIIAILDIIVLWNIISFNKVSKSAGRTLIPYFIWILYATYLNTGIFILN